jgi:hypothetical protein
MGKELKGRWPTRSCFLRRCGLRCCRRHCGNFAALSSVTPAGGPAFQPRTQLLLWVPRPSRGLRRAGITIADRIGLLSSHTRIPPLSQKARQRWGALFRAPAGEKQIPPPSGAMLPTRLQELAARSSVPHTSAQNADVWATPPGS